MSDAETTTEWEVGVTFRIHVDTVEEAQAVAAATGQAVGMLPFIHGEPQLVVRDVPTGAPPWPVET